MGRGGYKIYAPIAKSGVLLAPKGPGPFPAGGAKTARIAKALGSMAVNRVDSFAAIDGAILTPPFVPDSTLP